MANRNMAALIRQIGKQQGLTDRQIAVLIAGARVESGLNPNAVGDGGTSYGLYQMHVGGAGGRTHQEARRYLDPTTAIRNRARYVKERNITDGAGFAALQRPADPTGYAAKVNAALRGTGAQLNAPVTTLGLGEETSAMASAGSSSQSRIAGLQSARDQLRPAKPKAEGQQAKPEGVDLRSRTSSLRSQRESLRAAMTAPAEGSTETATAGGPNTNAGGVQSYKDILGIGKQFGLSIDGSNQTTGGKHAPGSYHYSGRAVDFGDAKNDPAKLRQLASWARKNSSRIKEFYYDPLGWYIKDGKIIKGSIGGHGDHVHIAM
jgi:hypothetical protein